MKLGQFVGMICVVVIIGAGISQLTISPTPLSLPKYTIRTNQRSPSAILIDDLPEVQASSTQLTGMTAHERPVYILNRFVINYIQPLYHDPLVNLLIFRNINRSGQMRLAFTFSFADDATSSSDWIERNFTISIGIGTEQSTIDTVTYQSILLIPTAFTFSSKYCEIYHLTTDPADHRFAYSLNCSITSLTVSTGSVVFVRITETEYTRQWGNVYLTWPRLELI
jgi:hypothetical protein